MMWVLKTSHTLESMEVRETSVSSKPVLFLGCTESKRLITVFRSLAQP